MFWENRRVCLSTLQLMIWFIEINLWSNKSWIDVTYLKEIELFLLFAGHHSFWSMLISMMEDTKNYLNTLRPRQNGRCFADDTFIRIYLNENVRISIKISPKFVPKGPISNIPAMASHCEIFYMSLARGTSGKKESLVPLNFDWSPTLVHIFFPFTSHALEFLTGPSDQFRGMFYWSYSNFTSHGP